MTNEPLQPDEIASREFEVVRRGFDQHAVRGFLQQISSQHHRAMAVEEDLKERVRAAEAKAAATEHPDESTMLSLLGEETTRVLTSAREAAADIRAKAEQAAERIIAEATAQAAQTRSGAVAEADKRIAEAKAEGDKVLTEARNVLEQRTREAADAAQRITAEANRQAELLRDEAQRALTAGQEQAAAIIEAAKEEGRGMVVEAQAVRERVLRDLSAKRKKARAQLEQLNAGRERLLEAYDVVRGTVDAATRELAASVNDARVAASAAARRVAIEPDPSYEQLDEELVALHQAELPITLVKVPQGRQEREQRADRGSAPEAPAEPAPEPEPAAAGPEPEPAPHVTDRRPPSARDFDPMPVPPELLRPRGEPLLTVVPDPDPEPEPAPEATAAPVAAPEPAVEPAAEPESAVQPEPAAETKSVVRPEPAAESAVQPQPEPAGPTAEPEPAAPAAATDPVPDPEPAAPAAAADPAEPEPATESVVPEPATASDPAVEPEPAAEHPAATETRPEPTAVPDAEVVEPVAAPVEAAPVADAPAPGAPSGEAPPVAANGKAAAVFARLHALAEEPPAAAEPDESGAEPDEPPATTEQLAFSARNRALEPVEKDLSKRLKRALADEQNEVLDQLRRGKPNGVQDLLPTADDHAARWATASAEHLASAAAAGAGAGGSSPTTADLAEELARSLVLPLRERIERTFVASDGNLDDVSDRVRALYREWKHQRLPETAPHFVAAAYARGVFAAAPASAKVHWVPDPDRGACPDCDDNVLAGTIAKGDEFPTGDRCAPAHPGCRCLVLVATA